MAAFGAEFLGGGSAVKNAGQMARQMEKAALREAMQRVMDAATTLQTLREGHG